MYSEISKYSGLSNVITLLLGTYDDVYKIYVRMQFYGCCHIFNTLQKLLHRLYN